MKALIGALMIVLLFGGMFLLSANRYGFSHTALAFGITTGAVLWIGAAIYLLTEKL